ncbi:MAG: hypothetical protein KF791_02185 [Verrucomicrobiae bacterium]|nr:hypothetical protein [Verrucomicrobiae bacterium]
MIRNVLSHVGGIGLYGVLSIGLFFAVFCGALLWALLQRRSLMAAMGRLPLDDGEPQDPRQEGSRHE